MIGAGMNSYLKQRVRFQVLCFLILSVRLVNAGESYMDAGNAYLNKGDFKNAEIIFRRGIEVAPENLSYHSQLALSLLEQGQYTAADTELRLVLAKEPKDAAALWYLSILKFKEEKFRETISTLEELLSIT